LAQQDNEWNRNMADSQTVMARSQKTIALITMFFLPATFFAVRNEIFPFASQVKIDLMQILTINSDSVYPSVV
jgi:hypothetical protein